MSNEIDEHPGQLVEDSPVLFGVDWTAPYSDLVGQIPRVYAIDDPGLWKRAYEQLPSQTLFHELKSKYKGFSGPVGSGKSKALCREAIRLAFANPRCDGLVGAPTYRMLADVTRREFRRSLREAGIKHRFKASDNLIEIPACGSTIFFRSLSDPERLVGTNLAWFAVDELTYCLENSWNRLEARLREPRATELCGYAVWTPKGFDWVYNKFKNPDKKLAKHECIFAKPGENKHLPEDFYESLRESYDERFFQQEVEGVYLNIFVGQTYHSFDALGLSGKQPNVAKVEFDPRLPICWSMDFNVARMSSVIGQYVPNPGENPQEMRILDEIVLPDSHTSATCDEFMERLDRLTEGTALEHNLVQVRIYGDAAGDSRSSKASKTDYQIIREWAARNAHRVSLTSRVPSSNPGIRDRVNSVNGMLRNERGDVRLFIHPRCKHLIEDLEQVGWSMDKFKNYTGELDKSKPERTHISDALGYFVFREAPIKRRCGPLESTSLRI